MIGSDDVFAGVYGGCIGRRDIDVIVRCFEIVLSGRWVSAPELRVRTGEEYAVFCDAFDSMLSGEVTLSDDVFRYVVRSVLLEVGYAIRFTANEWKEDVCYSKGEIQVVFEIADAVYAQKAVLD